MHAPYVSILTTAYNREAFIGDAIESALASKFEDFELIVVDDCSSDRTVEIAKRYTTDPRVRIFVNEKTLTDYANRNHAAQLARGHYLKYLDSDDVIYPHGLEVMVASMDKFPNAALGICRPPSPERPYPIQISPEQAYREHFLERGLFAAAPSSSIIRADAFR